MPDEEGQEEEPAADSNIFTVPNDLLQAGGGGVEDPNEIIMENLGSFQFKEFASQEELFAYVAQDGYGWSPEIPAVCFAFEVHENAAKNKYELEVYFRDSWPKMYETIERLDQEMAPISSGPNIQAYTKSAYNGINLLQVFAANSIL